MNVSDLVKINPQYRHWRKAVSLHSTIKRRYEHHIRHHQAQLTNGHIKNTEDVLALLEREIASETPLWEINTSISSRIPVLKMQVKNILNQLYIGMPEPYRTQNNPAVQNLIDMMNGKGRANRAGTQRFLLTSEIAYRTQQNWYIIFNTLTVNNDDYYEVFTKASKAFKNYIRNIQRHINEAENLGRNPKEQPENHTYFAVVEEGGKTGRLHIHVLHMCRTLPIGSDDPNKGLVNPYRRELTNLKKEWKYGLSSPVMVRYSPIDAYGKAGYRWPYDTKRQHSLQIRSPLAIAGYMAKYITKGFTSCKRSKLLWRVRKTHKLGLTIIQEMMENANHKQLAMMAQDKTITLKWNNNKIPNNILTIESLKKLQNLTSTKNAYNCRPLEIEGRTVMPQQPLLTSYQGSTITIQENNQQNIITLLTNDLQNEDTYKQRLEELEDLAYYYDRKYFPRSAYTYGTTSSLDHIY